MCNDYRLSVDTTTILMTFPDLKIKIRISADMPNIQACDNIKITDIAPIVRSKGPCPAALELAGPWRQASLQLSI
jgi:putative SOS response-associated peptidase YedK